MPTSHRFGRRLLSGVAAVALGFGMTALGASAASAAPAVDIVKVPGSPAFVSDKVEFAGLMYFAADGGAGSVLYSFDGTTITEVTGGGDPAPTEITLGAVYDGRLYFSGSNGSNYVLYSWDGTDFQEILGSPPVVGDFITYGGGLVFVGYNGAAGVWYSWDGSSFTELSGGDLAPVNPDNPAEYAGKLYSTGFNGVDYVLYSWDGTFFEEVSGGGDPAPGSVDDLFVGVGVLYVFNGVLYLTVYDGVDDVLYSWDGTDFTDLSGVAPAGPSRFVTFNGDLYFRADDGTDDFLYRFDGTNFFKVVGGTGSAPTPDDPEHFVVYEGVLYFNADGEGAFSNTLHSWDGTIFTEYPAPPWDMEDPIVYNGVLYFSGEEDVIIGENALFSLRPAAAPELAETGVDLALPLGIAGAALVGGVIVLAASRRRVARPE